MLDTVDRRLVIVMTWLAMTLPPAAAAQPALTFWHDVAPIVHAHCSSCHHPDGDAPFSLVTYEEVRARRRQIVSVTHDRVMPPWKPADDAGPFVSARRLDQQDLDRLARWVDGGAPEGTRGDAALPAYPPGWRLGSPDLALSLPRFTLPADGPDVFRNFVVAVPGRGRRYVRGLEFRPRGRGVHHANIYVDATTASRQLDASDPAPGYEGLILRSATFPDGHFLGWTPGQAGPLESPASAWPLDEGSDLVVQLHMQPTGRAAVVEPVVGIYLADSAPTMIPTMLRLGRQDLDIPAGSSDYQAIDAFVIPVDVQMLAVQPHAHSRARRVTATAITPDGRSHPLLTIDDWDARWQEQYRYAEPPWLPAGTTIRIAVRFDNTSGNPRNPDRPPHQVTWGWRTSDEMADVWLQMATRTTSDRLRLATDARRRMTAEDVIGAEVLVARDPTYVAIRNDAALAYMELRRPEDALRHFSAVTRLQPQSAAAWFNEGVALEAAGAADAARARWDTALRLNPQYGRAATALGNLDLITGDAAAAAVHYQRALQVDRADAEAHCGLARALTLMRRPVNAATEFRQALALKPDWPSCLVPFAWLLAAHADPTIRRPDESRELAERAVVLTGRREVAALDALALALAAQGQFASAVQVSEEAIAIAIEEHSPLLTDLQRRVALYRQRRAVIVPD